MVGVLWFPLHGRVPPPPPPVEWWGGVWWVGSGADGDHGLLPPPPPLWNSGVVGVLWLVWLGWCGWSGVVGLILTGLYVFPIVFNGFHCFSSVLIDFH